VTAADCRLTGVQLIEAAIHDVAITRSRVDLSLLRFARLARVVFDGCELREADFHGATLESVRFDGCDLTGASFAKATLASCELRRCAIDGLRGAERLRGSAMPWQDIVDGAGVWAHTLGIEVLDEAERP
jgi:uncharacterized protein YjbI with pentapeptide repeats